MTNTNTTIKGKKKQLTNDITRLVKDNFIKFEDQHLVLQIVREAILQYENEIIAVVETESREKLRAELNQGYWNGIIPQVRKESRAQTLKEVEELEIMKDIPFSESTIKPDSYRKERDSRIEAMNALRATLRSSLKKLSVNLNLSKEEEGNGKEI